MRRLAGALCVLSILSASSIVRAQDALGCANDANAIAAVLDTDGRRTRTWYWAWMAAGSALLVGQGVAAALSTGDTRIELATGAGTSVFIPGLLLIDPPRVLSDAPFLDRRLALSTVDARLGDPCIARSRAREILLRDADDEALATGWFAHTFVVGGNIAVGLFLGIAFHDWLGALKQAVGGSVVGELQILTLPGGALKARGLGVAGEF